MRLSRDDEKAGESASIENQRTLLKNFVAERGGALIDEYVDDGWSGTSFNRPEVTRLLEDAKSGKIDTVVVKDLSRFGRNYIQVGQYIDYIFPAYGIRFIAISDNVDTADRTSSAMDMMPIMNVFNEWHAANTSKKIRAVLDSSRRAGKFTGWSYPYGYKAGGDENRTAVTDEEAAEVVRRIFDLRIQGSSARAIARILTDENVPNPATHFTRLDGKKSKRCCSPFWSPKTVTEILSNPVYLGSTVQRKTTSVSYKNRTVVKLPESERIVKEHAHGAIISREVWDRAQACRVAPRARADKGNTVHALSGLLVCSDCGKKLKLKSGNKCSFVCRTYTDLGKKYCTSHAVCEREIEEVVLRDIRSLITGAALSFDGARQRYLRERASGNEKLKNRLKACKKRLAELGKLISSAFGEKALGTLPESVCAEIIGGYLKERERVQGEAEAVNKRLKERDGDGAENYVKSLRSHAEITGLTREICLELIEFITVGERSADGGREIRIYYKFKNPDWQK